MTVITNTPAPSVAELKSWRLDEGHLLYTVVPGFSAAAVAAGIRKDGRIDLGLIASQADAAVAGIFTQNKLCAAPVMVARKHLAGGVGRAIVANSGCANAATGQAGLDACLGVCAQVAAQLGLPGPEQVFPCSTGVIGQLPPADRIEEKVAELAAGLRPDGLAQMAQAIMTTDAFAKMAEASIVVNGAKIKVVGLAKGAGMIRPDMATMLAFVLTDAKVSAPDLQKIAWQAGEASFNRASVDGDTSTNDTLLLMASGQSGPQLHEDSLHLLAAAVLQVCQKLAAMLVLDGEGAEHLALIKVQGAPSREQARNSCYAIAHSPLCKTALYGRDPNWGRFLSALGALAGREDYPFAPDKLGLGIGGACLVQGGQWQGAEAEARVARAMRERIYDIDLDLGLGGESFWIFSNDLGHEYIKINADYRS